MCKRRLVHECTLLLNSQLSQTGDNLKVHYQVIG